MRNVEILAVDLFKQGFIHAVTAFDNIKKRIIARKTTKYSYNLLL